VKALTGTVGVTFSLYKDSQGGSPLWLETQNVQTEKNGHYIVMLGSTSVQGLPADLFDSGEACWLGVQPGGAS
jgi:trimeric autotransporter adhesin